MGRGAGDFRMRFTIDPPAEKFAKALGDAADKMRDFRPAFRRAINEVLVPGIAANLASEGNDIGEAWPSDNARYSRRKQRDGFGNVELLRSGAMRAQLASASAGTMRMGKMSASFGTDKPYARALNFGFVHGSGSSRAGKTQVRSRKFMGWNSTMQSRTAEILQEHTDAILKQAALAAGGA